MPQPLQELGQVVYPQPTSMKQNLAEVLKCRDARDEKDLNAHVLETWNLCDTPTARRRAKTSQTCCIQQLRPKIYCLNHRLEELECGDVHVHCFRRLHELRLLALKGGKTL